MYAQLGFCQGNSGDPIFTETFGSDVQDTALPPGTTTYTYANGQSPDDGLYTVSSNSNYFDWFNINDHTSNDNNGRMLIINSDYTAGEFYRTTINGLCENTTYEFSSWLTNLSPAGGFCGAGVIPINVRFEIWDNTDTNLLASGTTGNIYSTASSVWDQYALVFQSTAGQTSVILKMINNGSGGCGNDLAIDDIVFKSCGDSITTEDTSSNDTSELCSSVSPYSDTITALPDNVVFSTHFYQWQVSTDGFNWTNVVGEINASISVSGITTTTYYRAKVAEYAANLNNSDCITFSDVYEIIINQAPSPPTLECWETAVFDDLSCSYIVSGTQPEAPTNLECWETATFNDISCVWEITGSQPEPPTTECWETLIFNDTTCEWEITGTQPAQPAIECWESAVFDNVICSWIISGTQPEEPTGLECWETKSFNTDLCVWEITGTQPIQPTIECWETISFNITTCQWEVFGMQPEQPTGLDCWEIATFNNTTCIWEVSGTEPEEPTNLLCWQSTSFNEDTCNWEILGDEPIEFRNEFLYLCEDDELTLEALSTIENPYYYWVSGEISQSITIDSAGIYEVEVTDGCYTEIITFNVTLIENPVIENIVSDESAIIINVSTVGDYRYSLNGVDYQFSNVFSTTPSGVYTIFVKSNECDFVVTQEHFHFFIQKFITPNGDGNNDFFIVNVAQYYTSSEVYIFDRYGKLLFSAKNSNVNWDGTFNGTVLPTSDYWYRIVLDGKDFVGHFTLKR